MRIAIITATPASVAQGSGTYVAAEALIARLGALGHAVTVVRPTPSFLPTSTLRRFAFNWGLKASYDVDIVVGFDMDGYRLAGRLPMPFVAYIHGVILDEARHDRGLEKWLRFAEAFAEKKAVLRANLVLATSEYSKQILAWSHGADLARIAVVPPPVDVTGWQRDLARAPVARHDRPVVLAVAHWYPRKNLATLILAAAKLKERAVSCEIRIVGLGTDYAAGARLIRRHRLGDMVTQLGHVSHEGLVTEYRNADIFCLPSRQEGFGMVYVEAMAAGLPVVALAIRPMLELIVHGGNGLLAADSPDAVATSLAELIGDPALRARISATNRVAALQWDVPASVDMFVDQLQRLVAR